MIFSLAIEYISKCVTLLKNIKLKKIEHHHRHHLHHCMEFLRLWLSSYILTFSLVLSYSPVLTSAINFNHFLPRLFYCVSSTIVSIPLHPIIYLIPLYIPKCSVSRSRVQNPLITYYVNPVCSRHSSIFASQKHRQHPSLSDPMSTFCTKNS